MLDQIDNIARRYDALESQMADPAVTADYTKLTELAQERAEMEPIVTAYRRYQTLAQELEETEKCWNWRKVQKCVHWQMRRSIAYH